MTTKKDQSLHIQHTSQTSKQNNIGISQDMAHSKLGLAWAEFFQLKIGEKNAESHLQ
jgi:hypothetical protein